MAGKNVAFTHKHNIVHNQSDVYSILLCTCTMHHTLNTLHHFCAQEKLSDSFRQASAKIGATIGLRVSEEDGTITPVPPVQIELPEVHGTITKSQST
jgi:hypothetical protein